MRQLSRAALEEIFAEETGQVYLTLLEIDDPHSQNIYVVNDTVPHTIRGIVYEAYPFMLTLPPSDGESLPSLQVTISNVSTSLIQLLRGMTDPIYVRCKVVRADDPLDVQVDIKKMKLKSMGANVSTIDFTVMTPEFLSSKYPAHNYGRSNFRALFR